jgi:hypothetical protein
MPEAQSLVYACMQMVLKIFAAAVREHYDMAAKSFTLMLIFCCRSKEYRASHVRHGLTA